MGAWIGLMWQNIGIKWPELVKKEVDLLFEEPSPSSESFYCVELLNLY
jgi:hypothetical protein